MVSRILYNIYMILPFFTELYCMCTIVCCAHYSFLLFFQPTVSFPKIIGRKYQSIHDYHCKITLLHVPMFTCLTGLTNPPTSVSVAVYPPSDTYDYGTHTITCNPPLFTGGLNTTDIHYKVLLSSSTEEYELPGCLQQVYETCDMSCLLVVFLDEGYREFQVIAVDADGHAISQSSEVIRISGLECDVYGKCCVDSYVFY